MARRPIKPEPDQSNLVVSLFKNTAANRYDFKIVQFESGEVKELTETELNDSRIKYAIELGILEAQ